MNESWMPNMVLHKRKTRQKLQLKNQDNLLKRLNKEIKNQIRKNQSAIKSKKKKRNMMKWKQKNLMILNLTMMIYQIYKKYKNKFRRNQLKSLKLKKKKRNPNIWIPRNISRNLIHMLLKLANQINLNKKTHLSIHLNLIRKNISIKNTS